MKQQTLMQPSNFEEQNKSDWEEILKKIFTLGVPARAQWTDVESILKVLTIISSVADSNQTFYSSGGDTNITGCKLSNERGCLELEMGGFIIVKPKVLHFETIDFIDSYWSFFRLELDQLSVIKLKDSSTKRSVNLKQQEQLLVELSPGKNGKLEYSGIMPYADDCGNSRVISRALSGVYVIFAKTSYYGDYQSAYDGIHSKMNAEEFRKLVLEIRAKSLTRTSKN